MIKNVVLMGSLLKNRLLLLFISVFNLPFVYYLLFMVVHPILVTLYMLSSVDLCFSTLMFFARLPDKICPDFEKPKMFLSVTRFLLPELKTAACR